MFLLNERENNDTVETTSVRRELCDFCLWSVKEKPEVFGAGETVVDPLIFQN